MVKLHLSETHICDLTCVRTEHQALPQYRHLLSLDEEKWGEIISVEHFRMGGDWEEGEDEPFVVLGEVVSSENGDHAFTIQRQVSRVPVSLVGERL